MTLDIQGVRMRTIGFLTLAILLLLPVRFVNAHGFTLRNVGGAIMAENNDPPYFDPHLFGHALDIANATLSRNQSDHGGIDADGPGSGFTIPGDVLQMELLGPLWYSNGGAATLASPGVVLTAEQKVTGAMRTISSAGPLGGPLTLGATSSHEMIWSLPFGSSDGAYGVSYRIVGNAAGGQPFTPSDPLTVVFTTTGFTGDIAAAEQAIFAVAVPEPSTWVLLAVACLSCGFRATWSRRRLARV
jgi:hypothetical protein